MKQQQKNADVFVSLLPAVVKVRCVGKRLSAYITLQNEHFLIQDNVLLKNRAANPISHQWNPL